MSDTQASLHADVLDALERRTTAFLGKEIDADAFRSERVPLGVYEQRQSGVFMIRVRCPGGTIQAGQLREVAEIASSHRVRIHITTRQELQIHDLQLTWVLPILRQLWRSSLTTKGAGGNTIRNIIASPSSGFDQDDVVDVGACAVELSHRLLSGPALRPLPRKFKIAFARDASDDVEASFQDLGFLAKRDRGVPGFEVRVAGGLGARPRVGSLLHDFVPVEDTYLVTEAVLRLFEKYGDRQNRNAARLRFLWSALGESVFLERYQAELDKLRSEGLEPFSPLGRGAPGARPRLSVDAGEPSTEEEQLWRRRYVLRSKREGFAAVYVPVLAGDLTATQVQLLADLADELGPDSLRFTTGQGVLLRWIRPDLLSRLHTRLRAAFPLTGAARVIADSVACAGAGTCQLGICLSKNLLQFVASELSSAPKADAAEGLQIRISGCPNNCGRHATADLGFFGKAVRGSSGLLFPAYRIVAGGRSGASAKLGEEIGDLYAFQVPAFIGAVVRAFGSSRQERESFADWLDRTDRKALLKAFRERRTEQIPDHESPRDWGTDAVFSLEERGAGECSAGP